MGGVGVASATYGSAPLTNPALLAKSSSQDKVSLIFPSLGVQASDSGHLIDNFDNVDTAWDNLEKAIDNGGDVATAAGELEGLVKDVAGQSAKARLGLSMMLAVPDDSVPVAFSVNSWVKGIACAMVTQSDLEFLEQVKNGTIIPDKDSLSNLTSRAEGSAALITDYGVSVAHSFNVAGVPVGIGFTPKIQRIEIWNYNVALNNYDTSDLRDGNFQRQTISANVDAGLYAELSNNWTAALSVQNMFENRVQSREVNDTTTPFMIRPQVTAGAAWHNDRVTLSADVDLTPVSDFQQVDKSQYAAAGIEFNATSWMQLRGGYRVDMRGNDSRNVTGGLGLTPGKNVQFDLTAMAGRMRDIGAVAQLSFHF